MFHDERFPEVPDNVQPPYEFFDHLVFESVAIRRVETDVAREVVGPHAPGGR